MADLPGWFGPPDRELFGWFSVPDDGSSRLGVLLCPPIGEEEHNAHETFRQLAADLARAGMSSLRFDYHGTGDSTGRWDDADRVTAWQDSVAQAYEALRATGVQAVAAVGMRLGATLAGSVALRGSIQLDDLVMWDPAGGTAMLREGQARRPSKTDPPAGAVDTPGYLYGPQTVTDLRALDPAKLPPGQLAKRLLVLLRDDRPAPRRLKERYSGDGCSFGVASGQGELLDVPMTHSILPRESMAAIVEWLSASATLPTPVRAEPRPELTVSDADGRPLCTETVVSLGTSRLFGIRSEPASEPHGPVVVFINVANDRHVGPGRRWVDSSRALGRQGHRVLRIDQSGTGDSPCQPGQEFGVLYAREWLRDLPQALSTITSEGPPVVLVGLCSGAYSAMESAFNVNVAAVYAINVILHARVTSRWSALADEARVAARPPARPFLALARRHERVSALLWRIYRQAAVWNAPMATVDALARRGTDVVLIMSRNDGRHFREGLFWTWARSRDLIRTGRYRLLEDPAVDHPLMTQEGQDWAIRAIEADLRTRFDPQTSTPGAWTHTRRTEVTSNTGS